jgi:taurine dioxygenase
MAQTAEKLRPARAALEILPRNPTIGAEVRGVDWSRPVDPATAAAIHDALMAHKVVYFRNVDITPQAQLEFGRLFGECTVHPFVPHLPDLPEMVVLDNHKDNPVFSTDVWHSDETFRVVPPMGSILRCIRKPAVGGDTLWADMVAAYEGLSDTMRNFLSGLEALHDFKNFRHKFDGLPPKEKHARLAQMEEELPNPAHPLVRTHPVTGKKALFVNEQFTLAIKGMREDESAALLAFLYQQSKIPEYQFRLQWEVNTMVFWDNRPTQHYASNDYYPERRTMHRITIQGEKPA